MARIMIRCPRTGKYVPVGANLDRASFESVQFENNTVSCPQRGERHTGGTADVHWIEEIPTPKQD